MNHAIVNFHIPKSTFWLYLQLLEASLLQAQVLRKLKAVPHTRGLSYDPQGEFVAAVAASGLLQVWEMMNGKQVLNRKKAGPEVCLDSAQD